MLDNTYWCNCGKYQAALNKFKGRVPLVGKAKESHIDLLRCLQNIYYDAYNNGGCNFDAREDEFSHIMYWQDELIETGEISKDELSLLSLRYYHSLSGIPDALFDDFELLLEKTANAVIKYISQVDCLSETKGE